MRSKGLTLALTVTAVLCLTACGSTRRASERFTVQGSGRTVRETGDSLREEISRSLNENLAEHEVVTWTVTRTDGDTVRVERVTDRTRESGSRFLAQGSKVEVRTETIRDTVYIEHRDTTLVQSKRFTVHGDQSERTALHTTLKWIFWIIIGLIGLTITVKVCSRKR